MTTVLDDVTDEVVDARHIRRRVDDWEARVRGLYHTIGKWLPDGWTSLEGPSVRMNEEIRTGSASTRGMFRSGPCVGGPTDRVPHIPFMAAGGTVSG